VDQVNMDVWRQWSRYVQRDCRCIREIRPGIWTCVWNTTIDSIVHKSGYRTHIYFTKL